MFMIVDRDGSGPRLLSIDDSGVREHAVGGVDAVADQVAAQEPDFILVNTGALTMSGSRLVQELNRLVRFRPGYSWTPAPGDLPA